ncbi:Uncharacterised protein [uncultured archaeon]|nr:Uncharacterised protein [uncultured archaeon]
MNSFDKLLEEQISAYEGRHDDLIYQAPELYRLLTRMLDDPMLPIRLRPIVISAIAYFILPNDIIPEELHGPYGYVDDIFLLAFVADLVCNEIGSNEILLNSWDGEADIVSLIEEILSKEEELIGDQKKRILGYIGYEYLISCWRKMQG